MMTISAGANIFRLLSAATTNGTNVKAKEGVIKGIYVSNVNAAARFLKLYDKATAPTVGTDTPVVTILLPPVAINLGGNIHLPPEGIRFVNGIGLGLTTLVADSDTNAVAANEIVVNIFYQ